MYIWDWSYDYFISISDQKNSNIVFFLLNGHILFLHLFINVLPHEMNVSWTALSKKNGGILTQELVNENVKIATWLLDYVYTF